MNVKILRLGHSATTVDVPAGTSIGEALDSHSLPLQGYSLSVNGLAASSLTALAEGDVVTLVPKVEGGGHRPSCRR
jgi:sulfur carrier protein ThiS